MLRVLLMNSEIKSAPITISNMTYSQDQDGNECKHITDCVLSFLQDINKSGKNPYNCLFLHIKIYITNVSRRYSYKRIRRPLYKESLLNVSTSTVSNRPRMHVGESERHAIEHGISWRFGSNNSLQSGTSHDITNDTKIINSI